MSVRRIGSGVLVLAVAACSSSSSGSGDTTSSSGPTAAACPATPTCDTITPATDQAVPITLIVGAAPAATGGPIADGTYVLTKAEGYVASEGAVTPTPPPSETVQFAGAAYEAILGTKSKPGGRISGTFATSGTKIVHHACCPTDLGPGTATDYSADATHYYEYQVTKPATYVYTFTKQ